LNKYTFLYLKCDFFKHFSCILNFKVKNIILGKVFEELDDNTDLSNKQQIKKDEKIPMPIMLDVDSDDDNYDDIVDSALDKAPEKDLVDLAGILGNFKLTLYRK
jgi:hypothetical protein